MRSTPTYYFNHAGTSWPKPAAVHQAVKNTLTELPSPGGESVEVARQQLSVRLGMTEGEFLLTPGCTSALAIAVAYLPWAAGDRVLLDSLAHVALERPVRMLAHRGVIVEALPHGSHPEVPDFDAIQRALATGKVRAVGVSAANNVTGAIYPLAELRRLCATYQVCLLVDAAQVAGWWMDMGSLGDLVAFGGHKGLQGIWGIGGLYIHPSVGMRVPAPGQIQARPSGCDVGSVDRIALPALVAACEWLGEPTQVARLARAQAQIDALDRGLRGIPKVKVVGVTPAESRIPILAVCTEEFLSPELGAILLAEGVMVSAGLQCAPSAHATLGTLGHQGVIRISVGPSTDDDEITAFLQAFAKSL